MVLELRAFLVGRNNLDWIFGWFESGGLELETEKSTKLQTVRSHQSDDAYRIALANSRLEGVSQ